MGQLARGTPLRREGTVVAAGPTLRAKLGGEECVYWDGRGGLDAGPPEVEARPFWLELVGGERVLVPIEHLAVRLRGDVERGEVDRVERERFEEVAAAGVALGEARDVVEVLLALRVVLGVGPREDGLVVAEQRLQLHGEASG